MAKNEWINGYLEAILEAGNNTRKRLGDGKLRNNIAKFQIEDLNSKDKQQKLFSPTKYFVEEVVNSFDESDLYRTWIKVIATRNAREGSNRLENMCWRIWHLARMKKQIVWDDAQRLLKRRLEREQGRNDAEEDLADLSEGEKEKGDANLTETRKENNLLRQSSSAVTWSDDKAENLYIVLISMHGLVRGDNMELGRDSDTGGQVKYVVELARALSNTKGVHRVDLLTRQISSPDVDSSYGEPIEMLSCPPDGNGSCGAYIIRLPCGPNDKYIPKESLWPHIAEFVDASLSHIISMAQVLGEEVNEGKPTWPYVIHGHYADAGEVASHLSGALNVPMVLTGHSLGRNKFEQLLKQGRLSREDINSTYKIMRRIEAEEVALDAAETVVTSTKQEIEEQWGLYDGFDIKLERKLRVRRRRGVSCLGRYMPRMMVIPPGMDFSYVKTQDIEGEGDLKSMLVSDRTQTKNRLPPIWSDIMRFFTNPHKPMILAISRPDPKKNVTTLLKAFGECRALRELANLTLILGNRDDIEDMSSGSSSVLTTVLKLIDKYDLYGQVAYPKHHKQTDVPEIYRLAAKTKGVFINPALVEPFGLTLIEAAAYGLPIVATKNGGPVDIVKALTNGLLVDPHDENAISEALLKLVADKNLWNECRKNGLKNIHKFSWPEHCRNYLSYIDHCRKRHPTARLEMIQSTSEEPMSDSLRDVEDLSLKFSVDGGDFKFNVDILDPVTRQKEMIETLSRMAITKSVSGATYCPGRRHGLFVIAADCYDINGSCTENLSTIIKNVMEATTSERSRNMGYLLLTGMSLQEIMRVLQHSKVNVEEFDALVCNSGSELYFPWKNLVADVDYEAHLDYRWPGENIRSMAGRLAITEGGTEDDITEHVSVRSSRCFSYIVKPGAKTRRIEQVRQRMRMRGFRCHPVYTHAKTRLNVLPLFASRAQSLRYLSVRWGVELSNMVTFVGEKGDTDYEDLIIGLHKTVVLEEMAEYGSEELLRGQESYKRGDVVPQDSPSIVNIKGCEVNHISAALERLASK